MSECTSSASLETELAHFYSADDCVYRHPLFRTFLYSSGVRFLAKEAQAYWLLDKIAGMQVSNARIRAEEFQVWKLIVAEDRSASLSVDDGNGNIVATSQIDFTDFPLTEVKLYHENGLLLLPAER